VGIVNPDDEAATEIRRLDNEAGTYKKIVLRDNVIVGSIVINDRQLAKKLASAISIRQPMTPEEAQRLIS
jgi:NAD(P)H-nitrite reductase large subunit